MGNLLKGSLGGMRSLVEKMISKSALSKIFFDLLFGQVGDKCSISQISHFQTSWCLCSVVVGELKSAFL